VFRKRQADGVSTKLIQTPLQPAKTASQLIKRLFGPAHYGNTGNTTNDNFFAFIPVYLGSLMVGSAPLQLDCPCFQNTTAQANLNNGVLTVTFNLEQPKSWMCEDFFLLTTVTSWHAEPYEFRGTHNITWYDLTDTELEDVARNGIRLFRFNTAVVRTIVDVFETLAMFVGGLKPGTSAHVPEYMEEDNVQFLKDHVGIDMPKRPINLVHLPASEIHSGDFFGIIRLDGLDPMLAWGMGSHTGHTVTALWIDGQLYITESQAAWYWPRINIQRTPYEEWIEYAHDASYNVVHLPLSAESQARFNETAAVEFFKRVEGLPYGYHNMLFGWIDTESDNFPPPLSLEMVTTGFAILDALDPKIIGSFWGEALNKRLGTQGLNVSQCYAVAQQRGITLGQLLTMVEQDSWVYSDGLSMVCDVYIVELWKAAGLFGNITDSIQGTEFTNWDAYSLNFFNASYVRPPQCVAADPDSQFCQLMGNYRMTLPGYNSVQPYPHMREHCGGLPTQYIRAPGC
jgi:hypothetical protein